MNREPLHNGEIYHCYNRGVDKRIIFTTAKEYSYFIHLLYSLNDVDPANNTARNLIRSNDPKRNRSKIGERDKLVDILAFTLMPNHYHLLLKQLVDGGIAKFMQKVGTGYTMYFNERYNRSGALFQGRYKSVHIHEHKQLLYIPHYIHLNPLDLMGRGSTSTHKGMGVSTLRAGEFLMNYKWSSYPDYVGGHAFPSVTDRDFILNLFNGTQKYKKDIAQFISTPQKIHGVIDPSIRIDVHDRK